MKVLVVDDSTAIQQIIKDQLSNENFDIETADNGAEALAKYAKF
ncbi:MAG: response regulator, partial [Nitrosopumilales archaeon]|nr:response regulator [Nitrosopumilales archaeon]